MSLRDKNLCIGRVGCYISSVCGQNFEFSEKIKNRLKTGFTLIELLVVVAILAILAVVAMSLFGSAQKQTRDVVRLSDADTISKGLEVHKLSVGHYPTVGSNFISLEDDVDNSGPFSTQMQGYLNPIPRDPQYPDNSYYYASTSNGSGYKLHIDQEATSTAYEKVGGDGESLVFNSPSATPIPSSGATPTSGATSTPTPTTAVASCDTTGTLGSGLLGYWKLDETSGSTAGDSSGAGNNGTWSGTGSHFVTGFPGSGFGGGGGFGGNTTKDYINTNGAYGDNISALTISLWMNSSAITTNLGIISKDNTAGFPTQRSWFLGFITGSTFRLALWTNIGGVQTRVNADWSTADPLAAGIWYHLVAVYNGSQIVLYKNSVASSPIAQSGPIWQTAGVPVRIGTTGDPASYNYAFQGALDDVRIYNRALSTTEINNLYNLGSGCPLP